MHETTLAPLVERITQQLQQFSEDELHVIQDFVAFLIWKRRYGSEQDNGETAKSAESRAMERLPDLDDPTQWITVTQQDEDINEADLNHWLQTRGYQG
ncbi:hypothetical protein IQ254_03715 [Nodosilinea sp. LEGE 07088]|uniref:hypothetical protein n=1 Tax=Nodosilinea sp. LEGE 07088 TaxID=2777968 RepID=UPI00187EF74E|nr:hypothetical protein [Nodosilinea sp. LEGE 07088]MBE9136317.1 hypothetical protein [Nodosilinea sp. LEGE 07088]